jgi:uncharacterized protein
MIPRNIGKELKRLATQYPVLTITGPRQSGKTTLCKKIFNNYIYINLEDIDTRKQASEDPRSLLDFKNRNGIIIDEFQKVPDLTSYIQGVVDNSEKKGMFILTGSQNLQISNKVSQSLAGRTAILRILPLSFKELSQVKNKKTVNEFIVNGFYPRIYKENLNPTEFYSFYMNTYIERDSREIATIHNLSLFLNFIKILATNTGQLINYARIANDVGVDQKTIKSWISILEAGYIVYKLNPYFANIRKRFIKSPKIYFYDTGLLCYLLGINNVELLESHPIKGSIFENFVITEVIKNKFNRVKDNNLMFIQDQTGNEIDLAMEEAGVLKNIEIKYGKTFNNEMIKNLIKYSSILPNKKIKSTLVYKGEKNINYKGIEVLNVSNFILKDN